MGARLVRWSEPAELKGLAVRLRAGGLAAVPTETIYGLSCRALDATAVGRVARLKQIDRPRGFVMLAADAAEALRFATRLDPRTTAFLRWAWPAPLSAVLRVESPLPAGDEAPGGATAAFRVPAHARLRALVAELGEPLVSTSANRTGEAPLATAEEIAAAFGDEIDAIVVEPEDAPPGERVPSTIADCTSWPPRIVRAGRFDLGRALDAWSDVSEKSEVAAGTILFVCTGNTCRSALAEVLARQALATRGATARAASAGVAATDDAPASAEAREVAREAGLDLESHRARLLTRPMVLDAALVLVMGERQREFIRVLAPEAMDRVHTLVEFASGGDTTGDVSDPWGGDRSRYRRTRDELKDLVERSLQRWLDPALKRRSGS